jgi:glycosyltransferase involved in cell wall biosynthesis
MKIFILHPGKANYPEINAYSEYFKELGWEVVAGTLEEYRQFPDAEACVLWCIMGFYPKKLAARYVIHDYRSLSVGAHSTLKDRLKRALQPKPDLRIFQNSLIQELMGFHDNVDTILLPMGVPDWIFSLDSANDRALPGGTYCYVGEITRERGFMSFIADFLSSRRPSETLVLVGTVEKEIYDRYGEKDGLVFTGRLPQRDALAVVKNCEYAISTIPYCRPYNVQTPTKLLEYAALGRRIICNDSPSNLIAIRELGLQCMVTGPRLFSGIRDQQDSQTVPANDPSLLSHLRWSHEIAASRVERYLPSLSLNFHKKPAGDDRVKDAQSAVKEGKHGTLFLMHDVRGGGAELVTLNIVSGIVARGGAARIHTIRGERVDHELPANLTKIGNSITGGRGKALSLLAAARNSDVIVGSLEIKTHVAAVALGLVVRRPVVLWLHKDLTIFLPHKGAIQRKIYKAIFGLNMRFSSATVTVSEGVANSLKSLFPQSADKVVCLHNPVDFGRIEKSRDEQDAPWMQRPFVLAVGRLTWQKGFDFLIEAFSRVISNDRDLNLVILGEGDQRAALEKRVVELGLSGRVFLPGFINPYPAMRRASVIAMSSHFEGLPTVLIEALHLGAKIVSVDCPSGPSEVLLDGKLGKLVKGRSSETLADAIVSSLQATDTDDAKCLRAQRAADFSFDRIMPKWESLLARASR